MPSTIEQFFYGSLFSFILCSFMALGFFLVHDKILADQLESLSSLETNHDLHDIFENFTISQTILVVIDGQGMFNYSKTFVL